MHGTLLLSNYPQTFGARQYGKESRKFVLYTVAVNGLFREMARTFVASARIFGNYFGDIIIFTDKPFEDRFDPRVIIDTEEVKKVQGDLTKHKVCQQNLRLEIAKSYDFSRYDKILYSDVDILFLNNVWKFFKHIPANGIAFSREQIPMSAGYYNRCFEHYGKTEVMQGKLGANCGFFGLDKKSFLPFTESWRTMLYKERWEDPKISDQHIFNWLTTMSTNEYTFKDFPSGMMEFPNYYRKKRPDLLSRIDANKNHAWHFVGNVSDKNTLKGMLQKSDEVFEQRYGKCTYVHFQDAIDRMGMSCPGRIRVDDYRNLYRILKEHSIKTVLEIGPGASTYVFIDAGCEADAVENEPVFLEKFKQEYIKYPQIHLYPYKDTPTIDVPEIPADKRYDMAFVDGPWAAGDYLPRVNTLSYAAKHADFVVMHDGNRDGERRVADMFAKQGWNVSFITTGCGLVVLRKAL